MPAGDSPGAGFGVEQRGAVPRERGGTGSEMEMLQAQGQELPSLFLCRKLHHVTSFAAGVLGCKLTDAATSAMVGTHGVKSIFSVLVQYILGQRSLQLFGRAR